MAYDGLYDETPPPKVRFETLGEAWGLFQKQMAPWLAAGAIAMVALLAFLGISGAMFVLPQIAASSGGKEPNIGVVLGGMVTTILSMTIVLVLLGGVINAGFFRMALKQVRGETISVADFFDIRESFLPLLGMTLLVGMATSAASGLCYVPGLLLGGLWMLASPLIIERRMGAIEAMSASWRALQSELVMAACYYLVISLIASLGATVLLIGMVVTMPVFYLGIALVYKDFFPDTGLGLDH